MTSALAVPTTLIAGALLALPLAVTAAAATPAATPAASAPKTTPATHGTALTLVTGDHVQISTINGRQRLLTSPAATSGPGRVLTSQRLGSEQYVIPAVAKPYVGRFLDRNLFDVTKLSAAVGADGRIPVRIAYTGSKPAAPGVTITSASGGTASGYVTPDSAAAFGTALTKQFKADAKSNFPARTSLFTGITKLAADVPGSTTITPKFPMFTLSIKTIGANGKPQEYGDGFLMNVDDARKAALFVSVVDGEARASVPAGNYTFVGEDYDYNETTDVFKDRLVTVNEYAVTGAGQTLNIDYRTATLSPGVTTPKASTLTGYTFEWDRSDTAQYGGISWSSGGVGDGYDFKVAPAPKAKIGVLDVIQTWNAVGPGTTPKYTYDLASAYKQIPNPLTATFTASKLATVDAKYYSDGPSYDSAFLRFPVYPFQFFVGGSYASLKTPVARTEYIGSTGNPEWGQAFLQDNNNWDDPGFWDDNDWKVIPAGSKTTSSWLRGPLGANIPTQAYDSYGYCYGCRTSHALSFALAPAIDTDNHTLELFGAEDGLPVARTRFYQDGVLVSDQDDYFGGLFDVPSKTTTYKAIVDINRRLTDPKQATLNNTVLTFKSAAGQGGTVPPQWYCEASDTGSAGDCRVLPIVTAKASLPTNLTGRLPAGKSKITVTVSRAQNAATGTIASAGLEFRPAGWFWEPITLKAAGNGVYTGTIDNTDWAGTDVDLRVSGTDTAGNGFTQTIVRAYTVAKS